MDKSGEPRKHHRQDKKNTQEKRLVMALRVLMESFRGEVESLMQEAGSLKRLFGVGTRHRSKRRKKLSVAKQSVGQKNRGS